EVTYSRTTVPSGALSIATLYGLAVRAPVGGAGAADCVTLAFIRAASRATEAEDSPNVARAGRTPAANGRIAAASRSTSPPQSRRIAAINVRVQMHAVATKSMRRMRRWLLCPASRHSND